MQNIRGQDKKRKRTRPQDYKKILTLVLVGLLVINLIPGSVFADVMDGTERNEMTEVSEILDGDTVDENSKDNEEVIANEGLEENGPESEETFKEIIIGDTSEYEAFLEEENKISLLSDVSDETTDHNENGEDGNLDNNDDDENIDAHDDDNPFDEKNDQDDDPGNDTEPPVSTDIDQALKDLEENEPHEVATTYSSAGIVITEDDEGALQHATGFSVSNATGNMDGGATRKILDYAGVYPSRYAVTAFDMTLMAEGNPIDPSGSVKVALSSGVYASGYNNYRFYIFEGGSPTEISVSFEGDYAVYCTRTLERIYIYGYNISNSADEDEPEPEKPGEEKPGGETSGEETPGGETPGGETPGGETPGGETPGGETPGGETPGGETPGGETPGGETPGGETPGGETPGGETPGEETPGGEQKDEDDEYVIFTLTASVVFEGEKNAEAGTVEVKGQSSITPKEEVSIEAKAKKTSKSKITFIATPAEGYSFFGWFEDIEAKDSPITTDTELEVGEFTDQEFFAVFITKEEEEPKEEIKQLYVRAYVAVDGEKNTKAANIALLGTSITPKPALALKVPSNEPILRFEAIPINENYTFLGWYEDINGEGECLQTDTLLEIEKIEEKEYYAVFEKHEIETVDVKAYVAYNGERSSLAGKIMIVDSNYTAKSSVNIEVTKGEKYSLETYAGSDSYTFKGWYNNIYGDGNPITENERLTVKADNDAVYYAIYEKYVEVKVAFVQESTSKMGKITVNNESSVRVKRGDSFTLRASANEGYKFVGWYDEKSATGVTNISTKAEYTVKISSGSTNTSYTYYAYFKEEQKETPPKLALTNGGIKLNTNGLNLKKGYYQLTSVDITATKCPIEYSSWYRFTVTGLDSQVADINGENGYLVMSDLSNGTVIEINKKGWYTFFFKDANDVIYTCYILVDDDNCITAKEEKVVTLAAPAATKNTTSTTKKTTSNKTATTTKKQIQTAPKEKDETLLAPDLDKNIISARIEQKITDDDEPKMMLSYEDEVTTGEKITKYVYGYVGKEEPQACDSWYKMVAKAVNLVQVRNAKVTESMQGRRFEFPVDQVGWYYLCVSNEESGDQYYKAYLSDYVEASEDDELTLTVNRSFVSASLTNGEVAYIKEESDKYYSKGNKIKLSEAGRSYIYVIDTKGMVYHDSIDIEEDIIEKTALTQYVGKLQELLDSVTPLYEDEMESIQDDGKYVLAGNYDYADSIRYEGAQTLEYEYATQYEIDYETLRVKEAYEELRQEVMVINSDLVSVNDNRDVTIKAKPGEFLTYVIYPVDKNGNITPSLWTNYSGITSGDYVRAIKFEADESITFRNLNPGVYSFAIRTAGEVKYRNAIVCEDGESEISMIEYELEKSGGLFEEATGLLRNSAGDKTLYNRLSTELQNTYNAFDTYVYDNQVQQFLEQISKLNNILWKVQRMVKLQDIENIPVTTRVTKKSADKDTPGITIEEIK